MKKKLMATVMAAVTALAMSVSAYAAAPDEAAGFTELPIFEDEEVGFLGVNVVYFQAVPMLNGNVNI